MHPSRPVRGAFGWAAVAALVAAVAPGVAVGAIDPPQPAEVQPIAEPPPAPTITSGPASLTNVAAPMFAWTGQTGSYAWALASADGTIVSEGAGPQTSASPPAPLGDGAYTFTAWQIDESGLAPVRGQPATQAFTLDATAPAAPRITSRPPFPTTAAAPAFAVDGVEVGASVSWQVIGAGGALVQPPQALAGSSAAIGPLPPGSYVFQVRQADPAGNVSAPASEPFAIVAAQPTTTTARPRLVLPKMNTKRLKPRVGARIRTVRPILRWTRGPRRTTLYNVQIFSVGTTSGENATMVRLTKMRSAFLRTRTMRLRGLRPGRCYVWRVWPYVGRRFTSKPLGVSNFCVSPKAKMPAATAAARARARAKARARAQAKARATR